ncbi:MAG: metallopeptidase TldD-related protein [Gammaproteobacteria bacterium]
MMDTRDYFLTLSDHLCKGVRGSEVLLLAYSGEQSDFVRLNQGRIRQAGRVEQSELTLDLIEGARHSASHHELSGHLDRDLAMLGAVISGLREQRAHLPEDPHLFFASDVRSSDHQILDGDWSSEQAVRDVLAACDGKDLVGVFAGGDMYRGFANSLGQRNWFRNRTFNFDWSVYLHGDKAVKADYAGMRWSADTLHERFDGVETELEAMGRAPMDLKPGRYRTYLAPSALNEIVQMLAWGGFGLKSHRTAQTPLLRMVRDGVSMSPRVSLSEDISTGMGPGFTATGFIKPKRVELIRDGRYGDCLVGPRSAREFGAEVTGSESPRSLVMNGGGLAPTDVLEALGTGLLVNNLWYCNYTDRNACRITGMTRFACFWVEHGRIQAPVNVMRFDDSVYSMLGERLVDLTSQPELLLSSSSYGERSTLSSQLPGALVDGLRFTL